MSEVTKLDERRKAYRHTVDSKGLYPDAYFKIFSVPHVNRLTKNRKLRAFSVRARFRSVIQEEVAE